MTRAPRTSPAAIALLLLLFSSSLTAQQREWRWLDNDRKIKMRADLEKILLRWKDSKGSHEERSELRGADLTGADLSGEHLENADLSNTILTRAHLVGSHLEGADLSGSTLEDADLTNAYLNGANVTEAHLDRVDLSSAHLIDGADLSGSHMDHAQLINTELSDATVTCTGGPNPVCPDLDHANLSGAHLDHTNLSGAILTNTDLTNDADLNTADLVGADLTSADLSGADLTRADLKNAKLKDADFSLVNMSACIFEPKSFPNPADIASATNLEVLTFTDGPNGLAQLRKQFEDGGFRDQERQIIYALNRKDTSSKGMIEKGFKKIAFDWTCQYGMSPGRALETWLGLCILLWPVYVVSIHLPGHSGIYKVTKVSPPEHAVVAEEKIRAHSMSARIRSGRPPPSRLLLVLWRELRVFFWAGWFCLASAFNLGFHDINMGTWLRLLPRTEYELKAKGWTRSVAGLQSVFSLYLIALWVLTYFGRPFAQ